MGVLSVSSDSLVERRRNVQSARGSAIERLKDIGYPNDRSLFKLFCWTTINMFTALLLRHICCMLTGNKVPQVEWNLVRQHDQMTSPGLFASLTRVKPSMSENEETTTLLRNP